MNLHEIRPSSACFNPLQLVYPMYVQKWKVQSETKNEKIYVPLTNGLIFTRKNREYIFQQSSAHRSSYFWISVTDLFQTDAGNGPIESIKIATATSCGIEGIHILTNHWPTTFSWSCFLERSKNRVPPHHWFSPTSQHWFATSTFEYCQKNSVAQWGWTNTNAI